MSEDQIRMIIDEVLNRRDEAVRKRRQWMVGLIITVALAIVGMGIHATVRIIRNDEKLHSHTADGHPDTVKEMVHEVKDSLTEIKTTQGHIREDITEIKKKLSDRHERT